jgi:membrane-associated phospholipid phosphatase
MAVVAVVLAIAFAATYELFVRHGQGQRLDEALKAWWLPERQAWQERVRPLARLLGAPLLAASAVVSAVVVLRRRCPWALVPVAAIVLGGPALATLAKRRILPREVLVDGTFPVVNTLPSGHATVVATAAVLLLWLVPPVRRTTALVVAVLVVAGGATLILVAALHRPSDVVAGYLLAGAWSAAVLAVAGRPAGTADLGRVFAAVAIAAAVGLGAGTLGALVALVQERDAGTTTLPVFVAGVLLAASAGAAVMVVLGWAMGDLGVSARSAALEEQHVDVAVELAPARELEGG